MQFIFPNRRGVRVRHFVGQNVNQHVSFIRRLENFFRAELEKTAPNQIVDNGGTRRFGANPVQILELFLDGGIFNVLVNFLHTLDERRRGETFGRLGSTFLELRIFVRDGVALRKFGQNLFEFVAGFESWSGVKFAPADLLDVAPARGEIFALVADADDGFIVDVDGVKLHGVVGGDKAVNVALDAAQTAGGRLGCRNNCVVGGDFRIVPGAASNFSISVKGELFQRFVGGIFEVSENFCRVVDLRRGKKFAVGARVGGEFFFVERLRGFENLLGRVGKFPTGGDL